MLKGLRRKLDERFAAWALRSRPPEPVPVVLRQRRVYVLPTRGGLLYAVSLMVMLIGAINYNLSLGYGLVFLLAGLGVVAILHTFRNLVGTAITVGTPTPVFVGDTARFPLVLHSMNSRERRLLRLYLSDQPAIIVDIPPHGSSARAAAAAGNQARLVETAACHDRNRLAARPRARMELRRAHPRLPGLSAPRQRRPASADFYRHARRSPAE